VKLTGRQRDFLNQFLDLYHEGQRPLHYSTVAEHLRVSPMTAYDMLRLLEERGLVISEYVLPEGGGRGRSNVVFSPTPRAAQVMAKLAGEAWDREEWEAVKARILQALREGKGTDYHDLLEEILLRLPERRSPMLYATEMIAAVLLSLHQLKEAKAGDLSERLEALGLPGEVGLQALAGLTMGLTFAERANRRITSLLLSYSRKYQDHLARLSGENKRRLSEFTQEVMRIIEV
jgi:DNA-binding PadR family transcriptional regulator